MNILLVQTYLKCHFGSGEAIGLLPETSKYLQTSLNQSTGKSATTKKINTQNLCHKGLSKFYQWGERIYKKLISLVMIMAKWPSAIERM